MQRLTIGDQVIWLEEVNSTNSHAAIMARKQVPEGVVVAARYQTEGKGQRGNSWESEEGKNLTFSVLLYPTFLPVRDQFLLSKLTTLAICDTLSPYIQGVSVKWPNDIYVDDCKIAGILIENSFSSHLLDTSIIGIGLNVNQKIFTDDIPNPTSLAILTERLYRLNEMLLLICSNLSARYHQLRCNERREINTEYFQKLYRKDNFYSYMANGITFRAKIAGVKDSGELILQTEEGELKAFAFKEVSFSSE